VHVRAALVSDPGNLEPCAGLGVVAEIAGHAGADGECERGVRLGGADEHVVEHSPVIEQPLSETIVVRTGAGSMARTLWLAVAS
jgi:hypothetical protein